MAMKGTPAARAASASSILSPRYSAVAGSRPARILCRPSGCGLDARDVVHGDYRAEMLRGGPAIEGERKFAAIASGKKIQFMAGGPLFNLARGDEQFFVEHVTWFFRIAPVKTVERRPRPFIGGGRTERRDPVGGHAPVVVVAGLGFPAMQVSIGDPASAEIADGFERGAPVGAANVDEHAVHVEN